MVAVMRLWTLASVVLVAGASVRAATPQQIDAAIKAGTEWLKRNGASGVDANLHSYGIGPTCLAGLALLEAGVPVNDPAIKAITATVRDASYKQDRTYQVSLCLMYLDRLGDPADVPLIQMLAVRLLVGQTAMGGWGYHTVSPIPPADEQALRQLRPAEPGRLHPDILRYAQTLRPPDGGAMGDDNSNTQFALLALWMARKHGVPVDRALDLTERRFVATQIPRTGGWSYVPAPPPAPGSTPIPEIPGSPSMYCAGLIGLAPAIARWQEQRSKEAKEPEPAPAPPAKTDPDDPFFTPAPKKPDPKKAGPQPPRPPHQARIQAAFAGLGLYVAELARQGRGAFFLKEGGAHGYTDLYFLWSLERVGVVYGVDRIGGVDWYEAGAEALVRSQNRDGSWGTGEGYGPVVNTSFAVLFLCKSNLARDLSGQLQKEAVTELRAGGPVADPRSGSAGGGAASGSAGASAPMLTLPGVVGSESAMLAAELVRAAEKDWPTVLKKLRESKGPQHTQALVMAINRLDGERRRAAREALAERLCRMTAASLRSMAAAEDPELRRAAVLAMAMKDDRSHVPDLIEALGDEEDLVVRAARAGLRSLTGEDFGPAPNATPGEKQLAQQSWRQWLDRRRKD